MKTISKYNMNFNFKYTRHPIHFRNIVWKRPQMFLISSILKCCEHQLKIRKIVSLCAISGIIIFNEETYNRSHKKMAGHTWFEIVFYVVLVLIIRPIYRSNTLTTWLQDLLSKETSFIMITKVMIYYKHYPSFI